MVCRRPGTRCSRCNPGGQNERGNPMVRFKDLGVKAKLMVLAGVFVTGTMVFGMIAFTTLNAVQIGSDLYDRIETAKDAIAAFAPPDAALMPSNLLVFRILSSTTPEEVRKWKAVFEEKRKAAESQSQLWLSRMPDGQMKDLLKKATEPYGQYFSIVENQIFPLF